MKTAWNFLFVTLFAGTMVVTFSLMRSSTQPIVQPPSPDKLVGSYAITPRSSEFMQRSLVRNVGQGEIVLLKDNLFTCSGGKLEIKADLPGGVTLATIIPEGSTGGEWEIVADHGAGQGYLSLWHDTPGGREWTHLWVGTIDGEFVLQALLEPDELSAPLFWTQSE